MNRLPEMMCMTYSCARTAHYPVQRNKTIKHVSYDVIFLTIQSHSSIRTFVRPANTHFMENKIN